MNVSTAGILHNTHHASQSQAAGSSTCDGVSFFLARNSAHASTVVLCSMQLPKDVLKVMMLLKNNGSLHYVYWIQ
mgnify:CR=1 FL=1